MMTTFWKNKRVFLTGHTGFKGSWLSLWLQHLGAHVIGFSLDPPTSPNMFEAAEISNGMTDIRGDIRDLETLREVMLQSDPEVVIHMAAQALVRQSYIDPVSTFSTNVMGTVNLLHCLLDTRNVKAVVIVTSDKCYENNEWVWGYREHEPMGGHDPYSCSKGCTELVTQAFRKSYFESGPAVATARAGNVIGAGDFARDRLIPDVVRSVMASETVRIRNPLAVRPWQHVLDPLSGYMILAEHLYTDGQAYAEGWNFGPDEADARNVLWIVEKMATHWNGLNWISDSDSNPHEAQSLKLDASKARSLLGWVPRLPLADGLAWTVEGYRVFSDPAAFRSLLFRQLESYMELMTR